MKLTTKSEYAILGLIYIARRKNNGFVRMNDICAEYGISKKYLEQLFLMLKQNHYLKTKKGLGGGYALAKPADKISIAQIVRLMDGALAPTASVSKYFFSHTPLEKEEKITKIFKEIRDYISKRMEAVKLSNLT